MAFVKGRVALHKTFSKHEKQLNSFFKDYKSLKNEFNYNYIYKKDFNGFKLTYNYKKLQGIISYWSKGYVKYDLFHFLWNKWNKDSKYYDIWNTKLFDLRNALSRLHRKGEKYKYLYNLVYRRVLYYPFLITIKPATIIMHNYLLDKNYIFEWETSNKETLKFMKNFNEGEYMKLTIGIKKLNYDVYKNLIINNKFNKYFLRFKNLYRFFKKKLKFKKYLLFLKSNKELNKKLKNKKIKKLINKRKHWLNRRNNNWIINFNYKENYTKEYKQYLINNYNLSIDSEKDSNIFFTKTYNIIKNKKGLFNKNKKILVGEFKNKIYTKKRKPKKILLDKLKNIILFKNIKDKIFEKIIKNKFLLEIIRDKMMSKNQKDKILIKNIKNKIIPKLKERNVFNKEKINVFNREKTNILDKEKINIFNKNKINVFNKKKTNIFDKEKINIFNKNKINVFNKEKTNIFDKNKINVSNKKNMFKESKLNFFNRNKLSIKKSKRKFLLKKKLKDYKKKLKINYASLYVKEFIYNSENENVFNSISKKERVNKYFTTLELFSKNKSLIQNSFFFRFYFLYFFWFLIFFNKIFIFFNKMLFNIWSRFLYIWDDAYKISNNNFFNNYKLLYKKNLYYYIEFENMFMKYVDKRWKILFFEERFNLDLFINNKIKNIFNQYYNNYNNSYNKMINLNNYYNIYVYNNNNYWIYNYNNYYNLNNYYNKKNMKLNFLIDGISKKDYEYYKYYKDNYLCIWKNISMNKNYKKTEISRYISEEKWNIINWWNLYENFKEAKKLNIYYNEDLKLIKEKRLYYI